MNYYENELKALKKVKRYREITVADESLKDFASNDYLGLSHKKELHVATCQEMDKFLCHSAKASLLVNGYHKVHKDLKDALCKINGFKDGIIVGSGFSANIALVESLVRKGDILFMDELYHASGILATNLKHVKVVFFKHNDMDELKSLFNKYSHIKRKIVAVEGIYSMDGDLCSKEVFKICDDENALLIVDEAHSSGVLGKNLMGVFDYYDIKIKSNHIKMGTLGKAYGSFGAFILASEHITEYLINRAKPIIYATALSFYDTILAHNSLRYILKNKESIKKAIKQRQKIILEELDIRCDGLILSIIIDDNKKVMQIKDRLLASKYSIGAIRQPTVPKPIIRVIARLSQSKDELRELCRKLAKMI